MFRTSISPPASPDGLSHLARRLIFGLAPCLGVVGCDMVERSDRVQTANTLERRNFEIDVQPIEILAASCREIVQHPHSLTTVQQCPHRVAPDESRTARHQVHPTSYGPLWPRCPPHRIRAFVLIASPVKKRHPAELGGVHCKVVSSPSTSSETRYSSAPKPQGRDL